MCSQAPLAGTLHPRWLWGRLVQALDRLAGNPNNPLRHLGSLAFLAFWWLALSGLWLYVVLDTSVEGAYLSIEGMGPRSVGGLLRSSHRYAADALVILTGLHLLRELVHGHWRHFRRFSWLTGTALLPIMAISAIGGFWLGWDRLAQFSATATMELLDYLPLLGSTLARNFLGSAQISNRMFSLFIFVHVGMSLLLLFGLWFHVQRISRAAAFPPRLPALGLLGMLLLMAVVAPVQGQGPADLGTVPAGLQLDWILLAVHPLMYASSAGFVWLLLGGALLVLMALPFLPMRQPRAQVAVVDADNCSGCTWCFHDCPYSAITMAPHPSGRAGHLIAVVAPELCAGCGICAGSCPSSTPFRRMPQLVTGIDLPQLPVNLLREQLRTGIEGALAAEGPPGGPVVVFSCRHGADASALEAPGLVVLPLLCAGQLPPSFMDYAVRHGAGHVVVASCRTGGCEFRLGPRWLSERLDGRRPPALPARLRDSDRCSHVPTDSVELAELQQVLEDHGLKLHRSGAVPPGI